MEKICIGIMAHVDAGKTTLSEAILFETGTTRKIGRVDHKDAFLDHNAIERDRGITVFSKEARFSLGDREFILVDTPGHADFATEAERVLPVLDYAVLVISGADGVQSHTKTIWKLFNAYRIPTFVFVNKMDMQGTSKEEIMKSLSGLKGNFIDFTDYGKNLEEESILVGKNQNRITAFDEEQTQAKVLDVKQKQYGNSGAGGKECIIQDAFPDLLEELGSVSEDMMESYLEEGQVSVQAVRNAIMERKFSPVVFGSALKEDGVSTFLQILGALSKSPEYSQEFGARVYKITHDPKGNRLTHMKITGGTLKNKMTVDVSGRKHDGSLEIAASTSYVPGREIADDTEVSDEPIIEKIEQIRIYNGTQFTTAGEAQAGELVSVLGLKGSYAGLGLGKEQGSSLSNMIEPALTFKLELPKEVDPMQAYLKLKILEEEDPTLRLTWDERFHEIHISVMGDLETEILRVRIKERFDIDVNFGEGSIIYKETIAKPIIGIGHYEPLRHYAEVQLMMEPLPKGSGLVFGSEVSEDVLARNWQRLIMQHLTERRHRGVLSGAEITDMRITVIAGRAHLKHTEGGDFRQATYRAVRQGLRKAMAKGDCVLLEPMYEFTIEVPSKSIGRVMLDMEKLGAKAQLSESNSANSDTMAVLNGSGPVSTLRNYAREISAFTGGQGSFSAIQSGYGPCHNQEEVLENSRYNCDTDKWNPCGSVFCEHGAGTYIEWDMVDEMAHTVAQMRGIDSLLNASLNSDDIDRTRENGEGSGFGGSGSGNAGSRSGLGSGSGDNGFGNSKRGSGIDDKDSLEAIFKKTYGESKRDEQLLREAHAQSTRRPKAMDNFPQPNWKKDRGQHPSYLVIDGYNVIFAWDELRDLAAVNIDGARETFIDILMNYQGYTRTGITVVFDGYKLAGNPGTRYDSGDLHVVYTKEAETADRFIEEFCFEKGKDYDITVVTSDLPVQMAALGDGAGRRSAREFHDEVINTSSEIRDKLMKQKLSKNLPLKELEKMIK